MLPTSRTQCVLMLLAAAWVAMSGSTRAEDAAKEVAADGTVSVVVNPPPASPARPPDRPTGAADPVKTDAAAELLAQACAPLTAPLYDRPLPLMEALERSGDRSRRLWITQAYWKVAAGFALVRFSTEAIERLDFVAPGAEPHDRAVLDAAVAAARAELADARAELIVAQQELVDLVRLPVGEPLPWTVDRPLATPYQTQFDTIFAARPATGRVRAINRALPGKHEALEQRAAAVAAAAEAFRMTEADHAKGRQPIEAVAAGHAMLVTQQREFCTAIKAYNCDIAEYAMAVADLSLPNSQFATMLIGSPVQWQPPAGGPPAIITTGATGEGIIAPPPGTSPVDAGRAPPGSPPVFVPPPGLQPAIPSTPVVPQLVP
ncbi:MAG: hypothetical protein WCJ18_06395 [Planctomycetota bacterium]